MKTFTTIWAVASAILALSGLFVGALDAQPDVDAIKMVIDSLARALTTRDLNAAQALIADDAQIDSRVAKGKVSKTQWVEAMRASYQRNPRPSSIEYRGVKIKVLDADHASVDAEYYVKSSNPESRGFSGDSGYLQWRLERREGKWLIVESTNK
jgi:uncharacterized protein (TIGR02246 family)